MTIVTRFASRRVVNSKPSRRISPMLFSENLKARAADLDSKGDMTTRTAYANRSSVGGSSLRDPQNDTR